MKKIFFLSTVMILVMIIRLNAKPVQAVSFDFFHSSLSPYGEWIDLQDGVTAWRPNSISPDWKPYSIGRWNWTNNGWYWDSDEPFGWATYHYGRWYNDDSYGWIWIPDYDWGPSWVEWRYDNDYIGWAPLPPYASFNSNLGIRFSLGWHSHYRYWNFVDYGHFGDSHINHFFMDARRVSRFFDHTKYRTNYYSDRDRIINGGIDRSFIERRGGFRIQEREIRTVDNYRDYDRSRNDRNGRIIAYRPSASEINNTRTRENFEIKKGENRSSLERDKIRLPMDNRSSGISGDRINERNRDAEINRGTPPNRGDRSRIENKNNIRNEERVQRNVNREQPQINQSPNRQRPQVNQTPNGERRSSAYERRIEQRGNNRGTEKYSQQRDRNNQRPAPRQEKSSGNEKDTRKDDSRRR